MRLHKTLLVVLLVIFLIMVASPSYANELQILNNGAIHGLVIQAPAEEENIRNLNPGDTKQSKLLLTNSGENPFEVFIRTNIIANSEVSPRGGVLADILRLTIKDGDLIIVDNLTFRDAAGLLSQTLGSMAVGEQKVLDFIVDFSNTSGNEYQGATFQANWSFNTISSSGPDPGDPDPGDPDPGDPDPGDPDPGGPDPGGPDPGGPDIVVEDDPIPQGPGEPSVDDELVTVIDEEIPAGPAMPKTGEGSPVYFYAIGALIAMAGVAVRRKT